MKNTPVLIAGGGPSGMMLALELQNQGIDAILVESNPTTTRHPKMDITNARSMEIFRHWGLADKLRDVAVSEENTTSVVWCVDMNRPEIARFDYLSVADQKKQLREANDGTMALEPAMRVSQVVLEPVIKEHLDSHCEHIELMFGWGLESYEQDAEGVTAQIKNTETGEQREIRAEYLVGCDGAGSVVRQGLGIHINTISPLDFKASNDRTNYMDEPKGPPPKTDRLVRYMIHYKALDTSVMDRYGLAWHIQSPLGWNIISQNDKDIWTIHLQPKVLPENLDDIDPKAILFETLGEEFDCEILVANAWSPRLGLADSYGEGRVWLAGDSVHQVIPTGGYGMNCAVGDVLGLGWVLAANLKGWGTPALFDAYETERRHAAARYRLGAARHSALRWGFVDHCPAELNDDTPEGEAARKNLGAHIQESGNLENEAWGIEWGYRYDASPVICHEDGEAPSYEWEHYEPSTWPGVRPPNVFLSVEQQVLDLIGPEFTLFNFADVDCTNIVSAADTLGVPLKVVDINDEKAAALYQRKLVLVRPDQHVAWRSDTAPADYNSAQSILDKVRGE